MQQIGNLHFFGSISRKSTQKHDNLLSSVSIHKIQLSKWQNYRILNGGNLLMICLILRWFLRRFEEFNNILKNMQSESCSSFNIETRGLPANNWQGHHRLHASPLRHQVWSPSGKGYRYIKYYNNVTGKFERSEISYTSLLYMLMMCVFALKYREQTPSFKTSQRP